MTPRIPANKRALRGALAGGVAAASLSGWATIGRASMSAAAYARGNGPWLPTVIIYFAVLPLMGVVVGLLYPIYRFPWGAILLGFLVVFPLIFAFGLLAPMDMPFGARIVAQMIVSLVIGGGVGLQRWSVDRQRGRFRDPSDFFTGHPPHGD